MLHPLLRTSAALGPVLSVLLCCLSDLACGPKPTGMDTGSEDGTTAATGGSLKTTSAGATTTPTDTGVTGGATTTTTDTGVTGGATTTATTESSETSTDPSGTTTDDACADLADAEPAPSVQISLHNARSDAVFLFHVTSCSQVPLIEMAGPDADTPIQWTHDICQATCGQALAGACACPPFCPVDTILMIAPGGTHSFTWDGAAFRNVDLPRACSRDCGASCLKLEQAAAGSYSLFARASTSALACADPNMCTCEPNPEGWCDVQASSISAELLLAEATLDYPNTPEITLTFTD